MKTHLKFLLIVLFILTSSCSAWRHGLEKAESFNRYLVVDEAKKSFGYKRLMNMKDFRASLGGYVDSHGAPEMIYEFENEEGREGVELYYVQKGMVYTFVEADWKPDSIFLKSERSITDEDKAIYSRVLKELKP